MKKALITGITGQDGSYLAELLLEKGYEVHGITRRASISNTARIDHLLARDAVKLHDGDLTDSSSLIRIIGQVEPDEIYNLAAQSSCAGVLLTCPEYSGDVDALGVLRILEAVRILGLAKRTKIYQASPRSSTARWRRCPERDDAVPPYSPYAVAKQYGFWITKEYREAYGMFAVNGILFNHESERRGENFVTRKITLAAGRIAGGAAGPSGAWQPGFPAGLGICQGLCGVHVDDSPAGQAGGLCDRHWGAAHGAGFRTEGFRGQRDSAALGRPGAGGEGLRPGDGENACVREPAWFRPTDVDNLWGDPTKAKTVLGWNPRKTSYEELVRIMAVHDRELAKAEAKAKR